jgi:transcriptional regulator with GAF, ATPase, and Fis domain
MRTANKVGVASVQAAAEAIGGRYRVLAALGAGGEGESFAAIDETSGDRCAVKLFREGARERRVRAEFERLSGSSHPGVVRARDIGQAAGRLFLVTDLLEGDPVSAIAAIGDDEQRRDAFVRAARQIADALAYLHGRGVIHGDLSPDNVRLTVRPGAPPQAVLIDLGATADAVVIGAAVGTLGYAAPEALVGQLSPASDLFSLGATLYCAWTGAAPFGIGAEAAHRMLASPAPRLSDVRPGLPEGWDQLVAQLLDVAPERRPPSAREVLRRILRLDPEGPSASADLVAPHPGGDPLAGVIVGRDRERGVLRTALERLAEGAAPWAALLVAGPPGSGRRTLIDTALRDLAIARAAETVAPVTLFRGSLPGLAHWLGVTDAETAGSPVVGDDPARARQRWLAKIAAALEARAEREPVCAALAGDADAEALAAFVAGAPPSGRTLVVVPSSAAAPPAAVGAHALALAPLSDAEVRALAGRAAGEELPAAVLDRLVGAAAGHAATAAVLVRQLVEAARSGGAGAFVPATDAALEQLLERSFTALPAAAQAAVASVAFGAPEPSGIPGSGEVAARDAARAAGWLAEDGPELRLPSPAHRDVLRGRLGAPALVEVARRALAALAPGDERRALALEAIGDGAGAAAAYRSAAAAAAGVAAGPAAAGVGAGAIAAAGERAGQHSRGAGATRAAACLLEAARLEPDSLDVDERLLLATDLALAGRAGDALRWLEIAPAGAGALGSAPRDRVRLAERRAWLLTRSGQPGEARRLLEDAIAAHPPAAPRELLAPLSARLGRVLVAEGRYADAVAAATPALEDPVAGAQALEAVLLAHAYGGDLAAARRLHARLAALALPPARASYLEALIDQLDGALGASLAGYRRALAQAEAGGDIHSVAAVALNLGALSAEAGRYSEALAMQERAIRELGRLGSTAELGAALFNAAMLLGELGDLGGARRMAGRLRGEVAARGGGASAAARLVEAELAAREGRHEAALELFAEAASEAASEVRVRRAAVVGGATLLARRGRGAEAAAWLREEAGDDPELRLGRAHVLLLAPVLDVDASAALAPALAADAEAAAASGRLPLAWRAALAAARLHARAGRDGPAAQALGAARRLYEEIRMATPADHRPGLESDPDARLLGELARAGATAAAEPEAAARAARSEGRLRRLLRINKRLNSELRLPRLLELVMDTVIELTEAERGFLLLEDERGELAVKIARNIDQQTLEAGAFELSRSIARQAAAGGEPIVAIDAAGDPRFREALSVSDLHLRSVLAVPLHVKGRAVGTIYVDNRLRRGAFGDDAVQLVLDFAEQAAIAIENARLLGELRRRERQVDVLNRRLEGELAARKEELSGMKQELRESREALAVRYDYRNIVGRTPRMLELFRLLDRLTDTALPVVIQGESGTGKELVARALHFNGPRRERPFVSENCAAIPETLLESTLFGTVRGAFTGADHDTRGLFEVADGGTLFLDEVAEMSPGMQGKLLRVLQAGELRRVGSERIRKVDVRIVAATNRDLERMVEEGRFRQDLFFRLSVARISLPPLRERREDIPAIIEHLLGKLSAETQRPPKRVLAATMARLTAYRWPGNVRELENEIMRALALARGDGIEVGDLSPHVAGDAEAAVAALDNPDSLTLRPRVERLERALIREALSRVGGNQTRAAEALGLSRFGLQKKLKRYGLG